MRRISANYILPVTSPPIKNGILELDESGCIHQIIDPGENFNELSRLEFYNGILTPGFVNTYSRIEMSLLDEEFTPGMGSAQTKNNIMDRLAHKSTGRMNRAIEETSQLIEKEGTVAVGDHCLSNVSFLVKKNSPVYYYTFIEVPENKRKQKESHLHESISIYQQLFSKYSLEGNLTPLSFYSSDNKYFDEITKSNPGSAVYSVFPPVSSGEEDKESTNYKVFPDKRNYSLLDYMLPSQKLQIITECFNDAESIKIVDKERVNLFYTLCPNAIKSKGKACPDINFLMNHKHSFTFGTGLYTFNRKLSILEEMKSMQFLIQSPVFNYLLTGATINGAALLGLEHSLGSFEPGKSPGVNLIQPFDFSGWRLKEDSSVKKLV